MLVAPPRAAWEGTIAKKGNSSSERNGVADASIIDELSGRRTVLETPPLASVSGLSRNTRVDDAYDRIKVEILADRMPPGHQATEQEIANLLGMSRTPVREALIRLELEGLVALKPRHGALVLPIEPDDMREIYEILTALEPEAAASLAARKPTSEQLEPMERATTEMVEALARSDLDAWADADERFHRLMLDLYGNRRLEQFVSRLLDQVHRARMVTLRLREPPIESTREHRNILRALRAGDVEGTRAAVRQHRERAALELLGVLAQYRLARL